MLSISKFLAKENAQFFFVKPLQNAIHQSMKSHPAECLLVFGRSCDLFFCKSIRFKSLKTFQNAAKLSHVHDCKRRAGPDGSE